MRPLSATIEHELEQMAILGAWFIFEGVMADILEKVSGIDQLTYFWYGMTICVLYSCLTLDWQRIHNFDNDSPSISLNLVRLGVPTVVAWSSVAVIMKYCRFSESAFWAQTRGRNVLSTSACFKHSCITDECSIAYSIASIVATIARLRIYMLLVPTAVSFGQFVYTSVTRLFR